jgi:hypothetical protein
MSEWDDTRSAVIAPCGARLEPQGYKFVRSRNAFELSSASERRAVCIILVASKHGNYMLQVWCGVRNNTIEECFHRTSGVNQKDRGLYTTINFDCGEYSYLNSVEEIAQAVTNVQRFITDTAIPFLEKEYSERDYSRLLNTNPSGICPYHGNPVNRCHYGLIAAKLAADPAYEQLRVDYAEYLRSTNKGFYHPRFERFVADLESSST